MRYALPPALYQLTTCPRAGFDPAIPNERRAAGYNATGWLAQNLTVTPPSTRFGGSITNSSS
jgi:hypothetical protein